MSKKSQKLTVCLGSVVRDFNGFWEVSIGINGKEYTFGIQSEYIVRQVQRLIRRNRGGKAISLLKQHGTRDDYGYSKRRSDTDCREAWSGSLITEATEGGEGEGGAGETNNGV